MEKVSVTAFTSTELLKAKNAIAQPFIWPIPGSKSITNRALLLAAMSATPSKPVELQGVLHSDDTHHMINALTTFGIEIKQTDATTLLVSNGIPKSSNGPKKYEAFIGNSGTTVRFLTSFCVLVPGEVTLVGDEHMAKRPLQDLLDGLAQMGIEVDCPTGCPPLTIKSNKLVGGEIEMVGNKSSQYFTSVMLTAPLAEKDTKITVLEELVSVPYVEMTMQMMRSFGAEAAFTGPKGNPYAEISIKARPYDISAAKEKFIYKIEADASAASYAFAAAAATGIPVTVPTKVSLGKALQGDFAFVDILVDMGCTVAKDGDEITVSRSNSSTLHGVDVDMFNISDTVMTLAALGPLVEEGSTVKITNIANIRIKETDRLIATVNELRRLGQVVEHGEDWLEIKPALVTPAEVECYSDHRMAMSFAILGLVKPGITLKDRKCVNKTYPEFWDHLQQFQSWVKKQL